ncbi:MAG: shikimate dehydrogenase [Candidatus Omnitrophota bacterium]|nr:shikimate dehydrogenase [Candidatus Omnitrophota bacterium]
MSRARIYGLIGNPIQHSLSPVMHNAALSCLKIKAKYKLFPLEEKELRPFLVNLKKKNICGLNITIPYKERVLQFVEGYKSSAVSAIGAANTIVVSKKWGLKLFNTDYLGFSAHLKELKVNPKKAAIIGAGGAARAVCFALGKKKAQEVSIYDIDKFRSLALMERFNQIFPRTQFVAAESIAALRLGEKDILINASSVGMKESDPLLVDSTQLHPGLFIYDLIYNPRKTKLLKLAQEQNFSHANGLGMLLYQGVEALNLWISPKCAPVEIMRKALERGVKKL